MQIYIVTAVLVTALVVNAGPAADNVEASSDHAKLHAKWTAYKARHGKEYADHEEEAKKDVFLQRTRAIEEHNARFRQGLVSFDLAHNEMSDLTIDEVQQMYMGVKKPSNAEQRLGAVSLHVPRKDGKIPEELDWRTYNAVSPVKHQGKCLSCYAFAAVSVPIILSILR